jgi:hypothetical protein
MLMEPVANRKAGGARSGRHFSRVSALKQDGCVVGALDRIVFAPLAVRVFFGAHIRGPEIQA